MSATVEFPKSNVIQFPTAKPQQGYLDIFAAGYGRRSFDACFPTALTELHAFLLDTEGVLVRYEGHEDETPVKSRSKAWRGVIDIYRAGPGMRGYDAMLPVALADQAIRRIEAAGVPVRFDAPKEWNATIAARA
jgi:hypothetical protein